MAILVDLCPIFYEVPNTQALAVVLPIRAGLTNQDSPT